MKSLLKTVLLLCLLVSCKNAVHQEQISRFSSGKVEQRIQTLNGGLDGICEGYYENGILEVKGRYKNGKEDGVWIHCYPSQKLQDYIVYKNGKIIEDLGWDTTGKLIMKNGNGYGLSIDDKGVIITRTEYKNYLPDGKYEELWLSNGRKLCEGQLKKGRPIGKWTYWNEDGSINRVEEHPE